MTVEQALNLSLEEVQNMSRPQLRVVVQTLASAANKRVVRMLQQVDIVNKSPALVNLEKSGGLISTKGKTLDELKPEYLRAKTFLQEKTSTVSGWKKTRNAIKSYLNELDFEMSNDKFEEWYDTNIESIATVMESEVYKAIYYAAKDAERRGELPTYEDLEQKWSEEHDNSVSGFFNEV